MTAQVFALGSIRAIASAQRLLHSTRLTTMAGADVVGHVVPVPAALLAELINLARDGVGTTDQTRAAMLIIGDSIPATYVPLTVTTGGDGRLIVVASWTTRLTGQLRAMKRGSVWIRTDGVVHVVDEVHWTRLGDETTVALTLGAIVDGGDAW